MSRIDVDSTTWQILVCDDDREKLQRRIAAERFGMHQFHFAGINGGVLTTPYGEITCIRAERTAASAEIHHQLLPKGSVTCELFLTGRDKTTRNSGEKIFAVVPAHLHLSEDQRGTLLQNSNPESLERVRAEVNQGALDSSHHLRFFNRRLDMDAARAPYFHFSCWGPLNNEPGRGPFLSDMSLLEVLSPQPLPHDVIASEMHTANYPSLSSVAARRPSDSYRLREVVNVPNIEFLEALAERKVVVTIGDRIGHMIPPMENIGCDPEIGLFHHIRFIMDRYR